MVNSYQEFLQVKRGKWSIQIKKIQKTPLFSNKRNYFLMLLNHKKNPFLKKKENKLKGYNLMSLNDVI